ncbi:unnamed protein product [Owenia fusiformis]|uniref:Uncharacterized protein n=1 Tax=Owenia fusiformis TaxID=6347 RepID=A0A8J1Y9H4_OWEFU|nr:unnamed protein product [Owenia fusiformis]
MCRCFNCKNGKRKIEETIPLKRRKKTSANITHNSSDFMVSNKQPIKEGRFSNIEYLILASVCLFVLDIKKEIDFDVVYDMYKDCIVKLNSTLRGDYFPIRVQSYIKRFISSFKKRQSVYITKSCRVEATIIKY